MTQLIWMREREWVGRGTEREKEKEGGREGKRERKRKELEGNGRNRA